MTPGGGPVLFLVPARGGSKGIPGKNLVSLGGRPLLAHVLTTARVAMSRLEMPARLVVSTDDEEIARVARHWGAEVPFLRPPELARDDSPDVDALIHALDWLEEEDDFKPAVLVELQATSPLASAADVLGALRAHASAGGAPVQSVTPSGHPPEWTFRMGGDGALRPVIARGEEGFRRQGLPDAYDLNGAVAVITPDRLRRERTFLGPDTRGYVMPRERSVDIDDPLDLSVARTLWAERMGGGGARPADPAPVEIAGRNVGPGHPCWIIAEAGVNHNGDPELAHRLVDAAAAAGADAVKFQTFRAEALCAPDTPRETYMVDATGDDSSQFDMLRELELPPETYGDLRDHAREAGVAFLSTPFDPASADLLRDLGVPAVKIGSGEATHLPLLRHVAGYGLPVILSTGMCTLEEVAEAVKAIRAGGDPPLVLLHCVSCYPSEPGDSNLRALDTLRSAFGVPVGFSDHTLGHEVAVAAVALGASVVEKHLTLDRTMEGPDHEASLDPEGFHALVRGIRSVEESLGGGVKRPVPCEQEGRELGRRSLFAGADIAEGQVISADAVAVLRPGTGLHPREYDEWVGRRAPRDFSRGAPLGEGE